MDFARLVILNEIVTKESYAETLKRYLFPEIDINRHVFMQDNARPHTSKLVQEVLKQYQVQTIEWPAKSPDLNPIENLWAIMKRSMDVDLHADVEDLENAVIDAWNKITQHEINQLVRSFPDRLKKLVLRKGENVQIKACYL